MRGRQLVIQFLVEQFKRGALVTHFGYDEEDSAMQLSGIECVKRAIRALDSFGPEGREGLIPLLEDPDWSIRVFAAGYLVKVMPEQALDVLKDIFLRCPTRAYWTASTMLQRYDRGELDM
jgi:hypothetical protein